MTAHATPIVRRIRAISIPRTTSWGMRLALATAVISGVSIFLNAYAVKQVPDAAVYTTLKNTVAALLLGALLVGSGRATEVRLLDRRSTLLLLVIGVVGGAVAFLLFFTGLAQATAPGAAFIQKTLFVWVGMLAVIFLGERLGWAQVGAMGLLLAGLALLSPPKVDGASWGSGETMILAATLLWAVEIVLLKRLLRTVSPLLAGVGRLGIGVVVMFGYLAATGSLAAVSSVSAAGWAWVLVTGIVLAAYVGTWFAALQRAPASAVTSVLVVGAVITAGLQAVVNGTLPQVGSAAGSAALIGATVLVAVAALRERGRAAELTVS